MVIGIFSNVVTKVFGSRNDRVVKHYRRRSLAVTELEPQVSGLTDAQLRAKTEEFRQRIRDGAKPADIAPMALAVAREVMDRAVGIRNIFNPECKFDPAVLPASVRPLYDQTLDRIAQTPPIPVKGNGDVPVPGWMQVEIPVEIYQAVREILPQSRPPFRARPFDVQLIGAMVLSEGRIAEMKTGEGKTIVAPLACYLAALEGLRCHVVTVNDYLVQRDRDWVFPFYFHTGLTVGAIHPYHMQTNEMKQLAYLCDAVYGTNAEFGFDYLRDNMKLTAAEQVQKRRDFCIIDEVDSILIDEARTPLIISGPAHDDAPRYGLADQVARHLIQKQREWNAADEKVQQTIMRIKGIEGDIRNTREKDKVPGMREEMKRLQASLPGLEEVRDQHTQFYEIEREKKQSHLTHDGIAEAQRVANIGSFYVGSNMDFPHLLENALRAHVIYQRDRDYVVQNGEVIIVDEFTGRLMVGRQWSDGLHQAVEAKEKVKIKQETQTLATVTIQNFFKLHKRLAGMTGTALTEATEFHEIYHLDVVSIPTNVPVIRHDHDDLVFISQKDKWTSILDEIKRMHDVGRPVLVGTTSVENSEMLSTLLTKRHGVRHEVLNAKQHDREAQIIAHAGELGAVMVATNMAGRGTDIKLAPIDRAALVRHWQMRNILPREAKPEMDDDQLLALSYRHQARVVLGMKPADLDALSDEQAQLALLRHWAVEFTQIERPKADKLDAEGCRVALDQVSEFMLHRLRVYRHIEEMGGLHIVGTERHESRRIDNQLRGRAGRQGDQGSSRFFISLEDDLMKLFAGKTVLNALSRLGMKEGDAIEHRWITRSVERAQRKVEERNFEIRKNLLEYDEPMDYQRNAFYGLRQEVIEGRDIHHLIFDYITDAVDDAIATYLDRDYVASQLAEWCRQQLDVAIEPFRLRETDIVELQRLVRSAAADEARQTVEVTLGEYMSDTLPREDWDLRGLAHWAMSRFQVDLKQSQARQMSPEAVKEMLIQAALEQIERKDLTALTKFLEPHYDFKQLAGWAKTKFDIEVDVEQTAQMPREQVGPHILDLARKAYSRREIEYPVEFMLDMVFQAARSNGAWAAEQLAAWANRRYGMGWNAEKVSRLTGAELHNALVAEQEAWIAGPKLAADVDAAMARLTDVAQLAAWAQQRFGEPVTEQELAAPESRRDVLMKKGIAMLRAELTQLERYLLLQILDTCWKDHLYAMDQLRDSVGLRGYAEKDPRLEFKREGSALFSQMRAVVRDRVTDLVFRAKLTANFEARNVYANQHAEHAEAASVLAGQGSPEQQEDLDAAQRAGSEGEHVSRKQRRAMAAQADDEDKSQPAFKDRKKKSR